MIRRRLHLLSMCIGGGLELIRHLPLPWTPTPIVQAFVHHGLLLRLCAIACLLVALILARNPRQRVWAIAIIGMIFITAIFGSRVDHWLLRSFNQNRPIPQMRSVLLGYEMTCHAGAAHEQGAYCEFVSDRIFLTYDVLVYSLNDVSPTPELQAEITRMYDAHWYAYRHQD